MILNIKNMVCSRCRMIVTSEIEKSGFHPLSVQLGMAEIEEQLNDIQKGELNTRLMEFGFEIIDDRKSRLIEKIKNEIVQLVQEGDGRMKLNLSHHLSGALHHDYSFLSSLFSETEGITIEKYFIQQKIEKVKELLMYDELSLSEIAVKLGYSSVAHLSGQFRKVTGLTPTFYKNMRDKNRRQIEDI